MRVPSRVRPAANYTTHGQFGGLEFDWDQGGVGSGYQVGTESAKASTCNTIFTVSCHVCIAAVDSRYRTLASILLHHQYLYQYDTQGTWDMVRSARAKPTIT